MVNIYPQWFFGFLEWFYHWCDERSGSSGFLSGFIIFIGVECLDMVV